MMNRQTPSIPDSGKNCTQNLESLADPLTAISLNVAACLRILARGGMETDDVRRLLENASTECEKAFSAFHSF
jgi:hypothetical protein